MDAEILVAPLPEDDRGPGNDKPARRAYVVAVSEHRRCEMRRALVQTFADVVNSVVANVFIVNTELDPRDMQAAVRQLADVQRLGVDVTYVQDMNWEAISARLQYPAAVA